MTKKKKATNVTKFVDLAWENAGGDPFSWEAYNHQVRWTVEIAVSGFVWKPRDMDAVMAHRNSRYSIYKCLGESGVESLYALAVTSDNASAIREIERYAGFEPVIADNVTAQARNHGSQFTRTRSRIFVGAEFSFDGKRLRVNSRKDSGRFNCTVVDDRPIESAKRLGRKTAGRYVVGRDEIIQGRKARKP